MNRVSILGVLMILRIAVTPTAGEAQTQAVFSASACQEGLLRTGNVLSAFGQVSNQSTTVSAAVDCPAIVSSSLIGSPGSVCVSVFVNDRSSTEGVSCRAITRSKTSTAFSFTSLGSTPTTTLSTATLSGNVSTTTTTTMTIECVLPKRTGSGSSIIYNYDIVDAACIEPPI